MSSSRLPGKLAGSEPALVDFNLLQVCYLTDPPLRSNEFGELSNCSAAIFLTPGYCDWDDDM